MNEEFLTSVKTLNYAELKGNQETKLRELEKQFNQEFGTDYYLMVMEKDQI